MRVVEVVGMPVAPWSGLSRVADKPAGLEVMWKMMWSLVVPRSSVPAQAPSIVEVAEVAGGGEVGWAEAAMGRKRVAERRAMRRFMEGLAFFVHCIHTKDKACKGKMLGSSF